MLVRSGDYITSAWFYGCLWRLESIGGFQNSTTLVLVKIVAVAKESKMPIHYSLCEAVDAPSNYIPMN